MKRYHVRFDDNVQEIESCCTYQSEYTHKVVHQNFKIDLNTLKKPSFEHPTSSETESKYKTVTFTKASLLS